MARMLLESSEYLLPRVSIQGVGSERMLGLRLQVFVPVSVGVIARLALQQQELAIVGQRHVLHQLGQSFWVLRGEKKTQHLLDL